MSTPPVRIFDRLSPDELQTVEAIGTSVDVQAEEVIFRTGEKSDAFYLIEAGSVHIRIPPGRGQDEPRKILLEAGGFFGEIGLLEDRARMADAQCAEASRIKVFDRAEFEGLMSSQPGIATKITEALRDRLEQVRKTQDAEGSRDMPRIMGFVSAGDNDGASFLAANLALKVQDQTKRRVVVADLHFGNQCQQRYLNALASLGSFSKIYSEEKLTPDLIRDAAAQLPVGIDLIAGTGKTSIVMTPPHLEDLLPVIDDAYDYTLLDLGPSKDSMLLTSLRFCDVIYVVLSPKLESAQAGRELMDWLKKQGLETRVRFLVNRVQGRFARDRFEEVLGAAIQGTVSYSKAQAELAGRSGVPLVRAFPKSEVAQELTRLARQLLCFDRSEGSFFSPSKLWAWITG